MKYLNVSETDMDDLLQPILELDDNVDDTDYTYYSTYQCSLCGDVFAYTNPIGDRTQIKKMIHSYTLCGNTFSDGLVPEYTVHTCPDNSLGVAKFIGFKRIKVDNKEKGED